MYIFIFGLLFGLCIMPLLDSIMSVILTFFEMIKSYFMVKITKNNLKVRSQGDDTMHPIGFALIEEEEGEPEE